MAQLMRTFHWSCAVIAHTNQVVYAAAKKEYVGRLSQGGFDTKSVADDDIVQMLRAVQAQLFRVVIVLVSDADVLRIARVIAAESSDRGLRAGWAWVNGWDNFKDGAYDVHGDEPGFGV